MTTETDTTAVEPMDFAAFEKAVNAPEPIREPETVEEPVEVADSDPKPEGEEAPVEDEKKKSANRFTAQTRELRELERKAKAMEAELEALKAPKPLTPTPEPAKEAVSGAPSPEKYQYGELDPQYVSDLADYRAELKIEAFRAELRKEQESKQQEDAAQRETAARLEKAEKLSNQGAAKYNDFDEAVVPWAESQDPAKMLAIFEAASETAVGADIFYHLATNQADADHVMSLSPTQRILWMGRFEAQHAPKPAPKRVSSAPTPINSARGSSGGFTPNPATMDFATFERLANSKG